MTTYIALLRGINLVGRNRLPMKDLRVLAEACGCRDVRTYIQSGNVIFCSTAAGGIGVARKLAGAVSRRHGFEPKVLVLPLRDLQKAAAGNPFAEADEKPQTVHLFFLAERPKNPDLDAIEGVKARSERFALKGSVFYLHTPEGFGTSKLAERVERLLGVAATARNWRTVTTLIEMAKAARDR